MQVQQIRNDNCQCNFGNLKRDVTSVSTELFEHLSEAPAVKNFASKFNATLSVDNFRSSKHTDKVQLALRFEDIKPKTFVQKLKTFFTNNKTESLKWKTHATNEEELAKSIDNLKSETFTNLYES